MLCDLTLKKTIARVWGFLALVSAVNAQTRQYTVVNNCPSLVSLYIGGTFEGKLATGGYTTRTLGLDAGFFYTTANGGDPSGQATRAGFYGDNNSVYYYIVKDTAHFNTGISIKPNYPASGGFCAEARCDDVSCTNAFTQPPTGFPPPTSTPPSIPVYSCPHSTVAYTITFCPSGSFPGATAPTALHPNGDTNKCMDVRGANYADGTPVQIYDCNGTGAQKWVLNRHNTKVQVAGTNFCLDAGSYPANGVGMKIWQCYDNLPAQLWYYGFNNKLTLSGTGYCLDLTNGVLTNSNQLQTWQCYSGNTNQIWTQ